MFFTTLQTSEPWYVFILTTFLLHIDKNNYKFWTILLYLGLLVFNWKFDSIWWNF